MKFEVGAEVKVHRGQLVGMTGIVLMPPVDGKVWLQQKDTRNSNSDSAFRVHCLDCRVQPKVYKQHEMTPGCMYRGCNTGSDYRAVMLTGVGVRLLDKDYTVHNLYTGTFTLVEQA